ncbi:hypothetical protein CFP56_021060 [Quercus suber]|uniref:Uncharacterized protein n=1 Tax=Quercus suber TaxID=58331 RepID=A0AAW0KFV9_QUESU
MENQKLFTDSGFRSDKENFQHKNHLTLQPIGMEIPHLMTRWWIPHSTSAKTQRYNLPQQPTTS